MALWDLIFYMTVIALYVLVIAPLIGVIFIGSNVSSNWIGRSYGPCVYRGLKITVLVVIALIMAYSVSMKITNN